MTLSMRSIGVAGLGAILLGGGLYFVSEAVHKTTDSTGCGLLNPLVVQHEPRTVAAVALSSHYVAWDRDVPAPMNPGVLTTEIAVYDIANHTVRGLGPDTFLRPDHSVIGDLIGYDNGDGFVVENLATGERSVFPDVKRGYVRDFNGVQLLIENNTMDFLYDLVAHQMRSVPSYGIGAGSNGTYVYQTGTRLSNKTAMNVLYAMDLATNTSRPLYYDFSGTSITPETDGSTVAYVNAATKQALAIDITKNTTRIVSDRIPGLHVGSWAHVSGDWMTFENYAYNLRTDSIETWGGKLMGDPAVADARVASATQPPNEFFNPGAGPSDVELFCL